MLRVLEGCSVLIWLSDLTVRLVRMRPDDTKTLLEFGGFVF